MNVSQALDDVKAFLESDPLVQAAVNLVVPASTRSVLADVLNGLAAEVARVTQDAHDQGFRDAAVPVEEAPPQ